MLNSSGLITRGFGEDHRIITRGFGTRQAIDGIKFQRKSRGYTYKIFAGIERNDMHNVNVHTPVQFDRESRIEVITGLEKDLELQFSLRNRVDNTELFEILDEI